MRCHECKKGEMKQATVAQTVEAAGHSFTGLVPALKCGNCEATTFTPEAVEALELQVAARLAVSGESSGAVMKVLRKTLGLKAAELADLLDVQPETVSRWENDKANIDRGAMALLSTMVQEKQEGRTTARQSLESLRKPKRLAKQVDLRKAAPAG